MKNDRKSVLLYTEWAEPLRSLPLEEKGRIFDAILSYELYGTANKRYTGICYAHKARVLSACYYQNKRCLEIGDVEPKKIYLPQKDAEEIIGAELSEELFSLEKKAEEKEERIRGDSGR